MKKTPCIDCKDRSSICHGICEKYKEWKAEHERETEEQRKMKKQRCDEVEYRKERYKRLTGRKG